MRTVNLKKVLITEIILFCSHLIIVASVFFFHPGRASFQIYGKLHSHYMYFPIIISFLLPFFACIFLRDQVKNVPEQIEKYKKKKYYLHATELLVSTGVIFTRLIIT